ncbi:MAG: hypothetical protein VYB54_04760 [Pseudomonadota bacterium]|nr:hypothetical protein [Pseudomonadota bacterium]
MRRTLRRYIDPDTALNVVAAILIGWWAGSYLPKHVADNLADVMPVVHPCNVNANRTQSQ